MNQAADALFCQALIDDATTALGILVQVKDRDGTIHRLTTNGDEGADSLASRQDPDVELKMMKQYLLDNKLPDQEKKAKELTEKDPIQGN